MGTAPGRLHFVKGHGTRNDFVLLPDVEGRLDLTPDLVRAVCDRRAGIGGDGVLRVTRDGDTWFMDYRNADGSVAETCGNGIRVFARYLVSAGLAHPGTLTLQTRAGAKVVHVPESGDGDVAVEMGPAEWLADAKVGVNGRWLPGVGVSMGNPHLVVLDLDHLDGEDLDTLDLTAAPPIDPAAAYPDGVNVEFAVRTGPAEVRMRVHERGSGETQSCGTGACAVAVAAMRAAGERGAAYDVGVPGGRLRVEWRADGVVVLSGPAVLVAEGEIEVPALPCP
jgi:diaminopimelate epimerase